MIIILCSEYFAPVIIIIIGLIIMSHGNVYGAVIMTKVIARVLVNAAD